MRIYRERDIDTDLHIERDIYIYRWYHTTTNTNTMMEVCLT